MMKLKLLIPRFFQSIVSFVKKYQLRKRMQRKRKSIYRNLMQERSKYLKRYLMLAQSIRSF